MIPIGIVETSLGFATPILLLYFQSVMSQVYCSLIVLNGKKVVEGYQTPIVKYMGTWKRYHLG